jgi:nucleoside-diphosphate-sugar epimerase
LHVLILGCGYTGERVAKRFLARGATVTATNSKTERFEVARGALVLHSVPPEGSRGLVDKLGDAPARVVYLSTTGVYGALPFVDESTAAAPETEQHWLRLDEEQRVAAGPWSSLILRPAAIYGPGRGVQESLKRGACRVDENVVSRIHVDDLATHVEAGLLAEVTGVYPVADEESCTSREIAEFCARLLDLPLPSHEQTANRAATCRSTVRERFVGGSKSSSGTKRQIFSNTSRRVDGSAIRRALGITLRYPSYRVGIPASISSATVSTSSSPAVK